MLMFFGVSFGQGIPCKLNFFTPNFRFWNISSKALGVVLLMNKDSNGALSASISILKQLIIRVLNGWMKRYKPK